MNTMKLSALFAAISMIAGVAMAQPAETPGAIENTPRQERQKSDRNLRAQGDNPIVKLRIAASLESLSSEQKNRITEFSASHKDQFDSFREEMRNAMKQAKDATDRQARREAMKPLREKHQAMEQEISTFLQSILTAPQMQELKTKASQVSERGDRMNRRGADDKATTGSEAKAAKQGGKKGARKGKDGKRRNRNNKDAGAQIPAVEDSATTAGAAASNKVNPFAGE